jgi:hypothetical protein
LHLLRRLLRHAAPCVQLPGRHSYQVKEGEPPKGRQNVNGPA